MKNLLITVAMVTTVILTGCTGPEAKSDSYADIVTQARATHADAAKSGYTWKQKKMKKGYVDHYLSLAEVARVKGDYAGALQLAQKALKSAQAEIMQRDQAKGLKPIWEK